MVAQILNHLLQVLGLSATAAALLLLLAALLLLGLPVNLLHGFALALFFNVPKLIAALLDALLLLALPADAHQKGSIGASNLLLDVSLAPVESSPSDVLTLLLLRATTAVVDGVLGDGGGGGDEDGSDLALSCLEVALVGELLSPLPHLLDLLGSVAAALLSVLLLLHVLGLSERFLHSLTLALLLHVLELLAA